MRNVVLCAALIVCGVWPAVAQVRSPRPFSAARDARVFVSVNAGIQPVPDTPSDRFTFEENLETATVDVDYAFKSATIFDGGIALRVWKRLGAGVVYSRYGLNQSAAALEARIPHPFFFEQPREISSALAGLNRSESAVHMQLVYIMPTRGRLRVLLSGGPSRVSVEQEFVTDLHYDEDYPFDSATFRSTSSRSFKGSAIGMNAGADVAYMLTRTLGVGGMVRFTTASIDLDGPDNRSIAIDGGGFQAGAGIRVVF